MDLPSLTGKVEANPHARGLAIIITNDYIGTPEWPERLRVLPGTKVDGEKLSKTFSSLNFVVLWRHNVDCRTLEQIVYETKHLKHKKVKQYECIVFIFSGHGIPGNYVYSHDRQNVEICSQLIEPLLPKSAPELGNVPKLFFIDACRGEKRTSTVAVPKGKSAGDGSPSRGGREIEQLKVPAEGNFLVAYSTMPDYEAYEKLDGSGGVWLTTVARKIQECRGVSVSDVLTEVNAEMVKMSQIRSNHPVQQPEQVNRLNKRVFLNGNPENDCKGEGIAASHDQRKRPLLAAVFPPRQPEPAVHMGNSHSQPQLHQPNIPHLGANGQQQLLHNPQVNSAEVSTQLPLSPIHYQTMLYEFANKNCTGFPAYQKFCQFSKEHNCPYYNSCVTVELLNGQGTIVGDSHYLYITQQRADEEAAKKACEMIANRQKQSPSSPPQLNGPSQPLVNHRPPYSPNAPPQPQPQAQPRVQAAAAPHSVGGKGISGPPPGGSDRERLNYFFQTKKVNPQYDYVSTNTGGQPRYRCTIKYFMDGKTERVDSGGYYSSKGEAKEHAAKKVLTKEAKGGGAEFQAVARGRNATPHDKMWKSKLKEYYDKKGQPNASIKYDTVDVALERFQSNVTTPDLQPGGVQGDVCDSKREAEQSAAQRALQKLYGY